MTHGVQALLARKTAALTGGLLLLIRL